MSFALNRLSIDWLSTRLALLGLIVLPGGYGFAYWQWQSNLAADQLPTIPAMEAPLQSAKPDYAELARLFVSIKSTPDVVPVKESTLSIKLVASYVGGKRRSAAVIASSENKHKLYYQGDKLLPGVELVTVQARRVLIKRNGVLESVSLEERQPSAMPQSKTLEMARKPETAPVDAPLGQQKLVDKLNKLKALASGEM